MMKSPAMLDQMVEAGKSTLAPPLATRPGTATQDATVHGLVVAVEIGAAAEGGGFTLAVVAGWVFAVEALAVDWVGIGVGAGAGVGQGIGGSGTWCYISRLLLL